MPCNAIETTPDVGKLEHAQRCFLCPDPDIAGNVVEPGESQANDGVVKSRVTDAVEVMAKCHHFHREGSRLRRLLLRRYRERRRTLVSQHRDDRTEHRARRGIEDDGNAGRHQRPPQEGGNEKPKRLWLIALDPL